jgi:site-specific recombinase XerD
VTVYKNPRKNRKGHRDGWIYRFQYLGVEYKEEGFITEKEAEDAEIVIKYKIRHPSTYEPTQITFSQAYNTYLDSYCKIRFQMNTWRQKATVAKLFVQFLDYDPPLNKVTPKQIDDFMNARKKANDLHNLNDLTGEEAEYSEKYDFLVKSKNTDGSKAANRSLRDLRAFFNWAKKRNHLKYNICDQVEAFGEDQNLRYVPPMNDFIKVIEIADNFELDLLQTLAHTAGRLSECLQLNWRNDVKFDQRVLFLETRKHQGGGISRACIAMSDSLHECLRNRFEEQGGSETYVFPYDDSHYRKGHARIRDMMENLCQKANVSMFTFHAIRHFCAAILEIYGKTMRNIQQVLRHQKMSTTEIYLRSLIPNTSDSVKVFDDKIPFPKRNCRE